MFKPFNFFAFSGGAFLFGHLHSISLKQEGIFAVSAPAVCLTLCIHSLFPRFF